MKTSLVFLVALGLLFSPVFAGDDDYSGFRLTDTTPTGNSVSPIVIWNCDSTSDGPYKMHAEMSLETPFEENMNVEIYVYKPNRGEWVLAHTCTNVDSGGKDCDFYFPVYWGMSETNEDAYVNLLKAELKDGDDVYSRTFNLYISHSRTNREEVVYEKIDEFEAMLADCPGKEAEFEGTVDQAMELGYDCEIDAARNVLTTAINALQSYQGAGECEAITEKPDEPKESVPSEVTKQGTEPEEEPEEPAAEPETAAPSTGAAAEAPADEEGSACPVGLVLLLTALAGFMRKG